jgi:16S rRNA (uracil1498-N3)-methyltransferase
MPARRFFIRDVHDIGETVAIEGSDAHKIEHVLRLRNGDRIELIDSGGTLFTAALRLHEGRVDAELVSLLPRSEPKSALLDVAQAIPKGQKMDYVVEKLGELGVRAIIPFESERTVTRGVADAKIDRWRRLARSAAQQSGRRDVLEIEEPLSFAQLCNRMSDYDAVLFPWEIAERSALRESLPPLLRDARKILIVVGPEGGFSHREADAARTAGAHLLWLGPRILRTETAALVTATLVLYELGGIA